MPWDLPLSGWDFDLSEWSPAKDLWAAVDDTGDMREAVGSEDDAPTGDDEGNDDRGEDDESERGFVKDGVSGRRDTRHAEREGGSSD